MYLPHNVLVKWIKHDVCEVTAQTSVIRLASVSGLWGSVLEIERSMVRHIDLEENPWVSYSPVSITV